MPNVVVQTPTGDMLVNQLRANSLDAAVAYLTNAAGSGDFLDAIRIEGLDCAVASQPWAVGEDSDYPQLTNRLFQKLTSTDTKEDFLAEGFRWQVEDSQIDKPQTVAKDTGDGLEKANDD
jgi:DNA-binding transcriptional LysR family regulator